MFRNTATRLRSWWSATTDDLRGGEGEPSDPLAYHSAHPHRSPLAPQRRRRPGTVAPRPGLCLSPVRRTHHHRELVED